MSPAPQPSIVGSQAMNSLVPITGRTASGATVTPCRRASQRAAASRTAGVPRVSGYPGALAAAASAARTVSGTGSTGAPIERSTIPPGWRSATLR